jgi:hypothetical protein
MKVLIYVEGPSDKAALSALLRPIIEQGKGSRVSFSFHPMRGKSEILKELGLKAANHLKSNPDDYVFAVPDLYPMLDYDQTDAAHRSFEQLKAYLTTQFLKEANRFGLPEVVRSHYRIHCFKHDLEVLLLAAADVFRRRLKTRDGIEKNWRAPPETQNGSKPPKSVVEGLFMKYLKRSYVEMTDAPWILERVAPEELCSACPQNFKPLFTELDRLSKGESLG